MCVLSLLRALCVVALTAAALCSTVRAEDSTSIVNYQNGVLCPDAKVFGGGLITGLCWSSMFPIIIGDFPISKVTDAHLAYHGRYRGVGGLNGFCSCKKSDNPLAGRTIGFTVSMYMPAKLIEVTRRPYCSPTLGGMQFQGLSALFGKRGISGGISGNSAKREQLGGFYSWNLYTFPILQMMRVLDFPQCTADENPDMDLIQSSVLYPNWYNSELAAFLNPEVSLLTHPAGLLAMPVSAALANINTTTARQIDDKMFWVAGSWGMLVPFTGHMPGSAGFVTSHSLANTRAMAMLSRIGFLKSTAGDHASGKCNRQPMPLFQKSQFKYAMVFPVGESKGMPSADQANAQGTRPTTATGGREIDFNFLTGRGCSHNIGQNEMLWGSWRQRPVTGEDAVTLVFQWMDCCVGVVTTP